MVGGGDVSDREASATIDGDKVIMTGKVMVPGRRNANGLLFTEEATVKAMAQIKGDLGTFPVSGKPRSTLLVDQAGIVIDVNRDEDGAMVVEVELLDTPAGKVLKEQVRSGVAQGPFRTAPKKTGLGMGINGTGSPDEDGVIRDIQLQSLDIVPVDQLVNSRSATRPVVSGWSGGSSDDPPQGNAVTKHEANQQVTDTLRGILDDVVSLSKYKTDRAEGGQFARVRIRGRATNLRNQILNGRPDLKGIIGPLILQLYPEVGEAMALIMSAATCEDAGAFTLEAIAIAEKIKKATKKAQGDNGG